MSTVKAKNHQIGNDGTASNNFTIYQPSTPDGTSRWAVGVSGATTADVITVNSSGNVGIGTASPSDGGGFGKCVDGNSSTGFGYYARGNSSTNYFALGWSSNNGYLNLRNSGNIILGTNDTERMRIDSSGNVQVGMTAGTYRLNVKYTDNNQLWLDNDGSTSTGMVYANNGTSKVQLYWHNSLARYYITAVSAGVFLASGGTSWTSASDERVKDIIEPIENATAKLANWRTVIGKYKTDEEGTRRSFLIAQDVQTTFPEAVDTTNAEEFGLRYQDTIPVLVKAIQEQQTIIETLKADIAELKAKVN